MAAFSLKGDSSQRPRVVVVGLASCFGCQLQITNNEPHLMEVLEQIDLEYWQLVSSNQAPCHFDLAIIEGAVTTEESKELVCSLREKASLVMTIGACAVTSGVTGMAYDNLDARIDEIYQKDAPKSCGHLIAPRPVSDFIHVDSEVRCCPIDPKDFVTKLQSLLFGSNVRSGERTLCADCKRNGTECFYEQGVLCMGLVTRSGCHAKCVNLGRPCSGCAGLSSAANLESSRMACSSHGILPERFDKALQLFSQVAIDKQLAGEKEASA